MAEVRQKAAVVALDASLAYVLTSINVADDYFKEKAYCAELEGRLLGMTERAKELSEKLAAKEAEIAAKEAEQAGREWEQRLKDLEDRLAFSEKAREAYRKGKIRQTLSRRGKYERGADDVLWKENGTFISGRLYGKPESGSE